MESVRQKLRSLQQFRSSVVQPSSCHVASNEELAKYELTRQSNDYGTILIREKKFPVDFVHGGQKLLDFNQISLNEEGPEHTFFWPDLATLKKTFFE